MSNIINFFTYRHEAIIIQQIVQDISLKLRFINLSVDGKLVGMETRVKNVVSSLETGSDDIRIIGIKGIGGGGKTTLARAIFDHISIWFEGKSFVENVREVSKCSGLKELQKQILLDVLNDQSIVESVSDGKNRMKKFMRGKKVLVVLDDVDHINQLEALAGDITWFKPGSRIIITTRDEQVLVAHGVHSYNIHDVSLLSHEEAICLFSRYALMRVIPNQGYEELSRKVVNYAAGLPLTIKVLGSHLCGRSEREWEDALERLKTIPLKETLEILELSYNGLENDQKEIFLDVVCLLKGEMKDEAIRILESCGFRAHIGLSVLEQKSLITISSTDGLRFHDHIEEMGWNIVRRLHPHEPSRHNRLWIKEEIEDILVNELGTKATRSIKLKNTDLNVAIIVEGLKHMKKLRFLSLSPRYGKWNVDGNSEYLPDALQSLDWRGYPFRSLPKMFRANKLVNLEMVASNIFELWEEGERKVLKKIRFIDLTCSKLRTFDLSMTPHLETLNLQGCYGLFELQMPVECPKLKFLNLCGSKVMKFNISLAPSLETLVLHGCKEFEELCSPVECPNLKTLDLFMTKLRNLTLGMTPNLEDLNLRECYEFVELCLPVECPKLKSLNLSVSRVTNLNLEMTPHLETLDLSECNYFVKLHLPVQCQKLKSLDLTGSKVSKLNLGMTPHLETLDLSRCKEFAVRRIIIS
ncbi:putative P-loop containing nucleoside triphosphate hydrolase, leucine-rich repeat domain superfamily [Helianthus annuus]|nr:putative P-loop containing nucleoside triphosphate hydrolase, leucine-rich repeat domain superfamily [Helianthus annuus]